MGSIFSVTCRNKQCRYHVKLHDGEGMSLFSILHNLQEEIKKNRNASNDVLRLLDNGSDFQGYATYLCPNCQEWVSNVEPYLFEAIHVSPHGTVREYKLHYLYQRPRCSKCNTELIFILDPMSGKNKCPKCGTENMKCSFAGFFD